MQAPFKSYYGGKSGNGVYQTIINHIPACNVYIEPFLGNGGVLRKLKLPETVAACDVNFEVINKWLGLQKNGQYKQVSFFYEDGMIILNRYIRINSKDYFIYCDPPYLFETRKNTRPLYGKHEWDIEMHARFLSMAVTARCNVMISHYPCKMYDDALKGWHIHDYMACTRNGMAHERLYMNYPPPVVLQDYRYLGKDYREREAIKKKTTSLLNKINRMSEVQRLSVLSALTAQYKDAPVLLNKNS